jgi:hypothetical protein
MLAKLNTDAETKNEIKKLKPFIKAFIYADEAIKNLIKEYKKREGYENTIFVITSDHNFGPTAINNLDLYYVPFMIYSPMLNHSKEIKSISGHANVLPALTAFLKNNYAMELPETVHWNSNPLDTAESFGNIHSFAFMKNNKSISQYIDGKYFLDGNELYELTDGLKLNTMANKDLESQLREKRDLYNKMNIYACEYNRLIPGSHAFLKRLSDVLISRKTDIAQLVKIKPGENSNGVVYDSLVWFKGNNQFPLQIVNYKLDKKYVEIEVSLEFDYKILNTQSIEKPNGIVVEIKNENNEFLAWEIFEFDSNGKTLWQNKEIKHNIALKGLGLKDGDLLNIYFWNKSGNDFTIKNMEINVLGIYSI